MSISFSCECGKKLAAKDGFAGRRLKCPGCGTSLTIPHRRAAATQLAGAAAGSGVATQKDVRTVLASSEFVHFACTCGRKMRARLADVGQDIDCPRCGQEMAIPAAHGKVPVTTNGGPHKVTQPNKTAAPVNAAAPKTPPVTKRIDPIPPLTARAPMAPATTRTIQASGASAGKILPASAPKTSAAPRTIKAPIEAGPMPNDSLLTQHLTPWRDAEAQRQAGKPPKEPRVHSRWLLPLAALLVLGLIAGEWYLVEASRGNPRPEAEPQLGSLALIPAKAVSVTTFRVADILHDKKRPEDGFTALVKEHLNRIDLKWEHKDLERVIVLLMEFDIARAPRKLEPLGAGMPGKGGKGGKGDKGGQSVDPKTKDPTTDQVIIFQTRQPFGEHDVLLRVLGSINYIRTQVGRHGYWQSNLLGEKAVYFIDAQTFAFGEIAAIEHFVREQSVEGLPPALESFGKAALQHDFVVGLNLTTQTPFGPKEAIPPLKAFRSAEVVRDDDRLGQSKEPTWMVRLVYANPKAAEAARKALDQFKVPADAMNLSGSTLQVTLQVRGGNDAEVAAVLGAVQGVVNRNSTLRIRESGNRPGPLGPPK
jgi:hypothetical protein